MVPMCFSRTYASNDMQYDLQYTRDLDLRQNSDIDLLRSICTYFNASRREEHDAAKNMSLAFLVRKLFAKPVFAKKRYFDLS